MENKDKRRKLKAITFGEFKLLADQYPERGLIYPYEYDKLPDQAIGFVDGWSRVFTVLEFSQEAQCALKVILYRK